MENDASSYFSESYSSARQCFLEAAADLRGLHRSYSLPQDNSLTFDEITIGANKPTSVLFVNSGLHGAELLAGSAIQNKMLKHPIMHALPEGLAVVFGHALNPYGCYYGRRVNENNVDLNRNFLDWEQIIPSPHALNARLHSIINPDVWNWKESLKGVDEIVQEHGVGQLQAALQRGQYIDPNGIFYGGAQSEWSNDIFIEMVDRHKSVTGHIVLIDIHTGLGGRGQGTILSGHKTALGREWWGLDVPSEDKKPITAEGITGTIGCGFRQSVNPKATTMSVCLEFGTVKLFEAFEALAYDNWVHAHNRPENEVLKANNMMCESFSPRDKVWKRDVVNRGEEVIVQTIEGLSSVM